MSHVDRRVHRHAHGDARLQAQDQEGAFQGGRAGDAGGARDGDRGAAECGGVRTGDPSIPVILSAYGSGRICSEARRRWRDKFLIETGIWRACEKFSVNS